MSLAYRTAQGWNARVAPFDTARTKAASPALALLALALASCAGAGTVAQGTQADAIPSLEAAEKASVARSLAKVEPGATAPWTELGTDAVGTARIIGEAEGDCLPVEVMRLRNDRLDTLRLAFCEPLPT